MSQRDDSARRLVRKRPEPETAARSSRRGKSATGEEPQSAWHRGRTQIADFVRRHRPILIRLGQAVVAICLLVVLVIVFRWVQKIPERRALSEVKAAGGDFRPNPKGEIDSIWLEGPDVTDARVDTVARELPALSALVRIQLKGTSVEGRGLERFRDLASVRVLDLQDSELTDAGLEVIGTLTGLTSLNLSGTKVTAQGLTQLKGLKSLRVIDLSRTAIGDNGVRLLAEIPSLKSIRLSGVRCSPATVSQLKQKLGTVSISLQ